MTFKDMCDRKIINCFRRTVMLRSFRNYGLCCLKRNMTNLHMKELERSLQSFVFFLPFEAHADDYRVSPIMSPWQP